MLRRTALTAATILVAAAMTSVAAGTADGRETSTRSHAGPPYQYTTELMGQFVVIPLKDQGQLTKTDHGYRFRTGQQNSHLVVTLTYGKLHLVDTGTKSWRKLSPACQKEKVKVGIAAVCRVPAGISMQRPLLLEVWPRLGNDYTDTSSLPATFAVTVLGDKGRDVAHLGAGPDFFNGHSGRDVVWGGDGDDWIRAGLDNDVVWGGAGNDDLVAMQGRDNVHGGDGDDRVGGAEGGDRLWGDAGTDFILCGPGHDNAKADAGDRIFHDCEAVVRR